MKFNFEILKIILRFEQKNMNIKFLPLIVLVLLFSCDENEIEKKTSPEQIIEKYYNSLNIAEFDSISNFVNDSIVYKEIDFEIAKNIKEFKGNFNWDITFEPKYEIQQIEQKDDKYEVVFSKTCKRVDFLQDKPIVCKSIFTVLDGKIKEIVTTEFIEFDFEIWQQRKDSLVNFIETNHPELSGFIFDQTVEGAENYLKAIELFENHEPEPTVERNCLSVPLRVYLDDPDETGTNIRKSPGGEVVMQIKKEGGNEEYFLHVIEAQDGWFKLESTFEGMEDVFEIPGGVGWIHGSVIAVDTRNYGGQTLNLLSEPETGEIISSITQEAYGLNLKDLCGEWAQVDYNGIVGWIEIEWLCGNPLTNCC